MWFLVASLSRWNTVWATILVDVSQPAGARSSCADGIVRMLNVSRSRGTTFLFLVYRLEIRVFCCSEQCVESLRRPYPHVVTVSTSSYNVSAQRLRTTSLCTRAQVPSASWLVVAHSSLELSCDKIHPYLVNCVLLLNELVYVADCVY